MQSSDEAGAGGAQSPENQEHMLGEDELFMNKSLCHDSFHMLEKPETMHK